MESEEACGTRRTERVENQTNQQNKLENRLIRCILDAGEVILKSGGEINRVEDTMARMCRAYGFVRTDVFTITSSIVITVYTAGARLRLRSGSWNGVSVKFRIQKSWSRGK